MKTPSVVPKSGLTSAKAIHIQTVYDSNWPHPVGVFLFSIKRSDLLGEQPGRP